MDECKPLAVGVCVSRGAAATGSGEWVAHDAFSEARGRGLHSFTFLLNVSAFCAIGGALRVCLGVILRVFIRCRGVLGGIGGLKGVLFHIRYGSG